MAASPKISVCLPVFNGEKHLAQAIESVLAQTLTGFELIICDNASTDATGEIAQKYADKDKRVIYTRNAENIGVCANYNLSFSKARGQYIKPFAHDDLLSSDFLEKMAAVLDSQPDVGLVSCGKNIVNADGKVVDHHLQFLDSRKVSGRDVIKYNLIRLTNWVGEPACVMFRRELTGTGFDANYYHYCEIEFYFRVLANSDFYYLSETLCSFRVHQGSVSSRNHKAMLFALDIFRLGRQYRKYIEEFGESEEMFNRRAVESIAVHVDHLCRTKGLTCESLNSGDYQDAVTQLNGFKEVSFRSVQYLTEVLAQLHDSQCRYEMEKARLEAELANLRNSTSWRITAPWRKLIAKQRVLR